MKTHRSEVVLVLFPNSDMTDNLATVLDSEIDSALGPLPDMNAVEMALNHTLALA